MKNIKIKQELIISGQYDKYLLRRRLLLANYLFDEMTDSELYQMTIEEMAACEQMRKQKYACFTRLVDHVRFMLQEYENVYFLTLTFNEYALGLAPDTRRQKIHRLLAKNCLDYVANIDFGKKNEREHYHAVIATRMPLEHIHKTKNRYSSSWLDQYNYGFYKCEKITVTDKSFKQLSGYITKLANHSIKVKQTKVMIKKGSQYQQIKKVNELFHKPFKAPKTLQERQAEREVEVISKICELFGITEDQISFAAEY